MLVASGAFIAGWLDFPRSLDCKHIQMSPSQGLASLRDGHRSPQQHGMRKMKRNNLDGVLTVKGGTLFNPSLQSKNAPC